MAKGLPQAQLSCSLDEVPVETGVTGEVRANGSQSSWLPFMKLLPCAGPESSALHSALHLGLMVTLQGMHHHPHFTDEETEAQRGKKTCLRSCS